MEHDKLASLSEDVPAVQFEGVSKAFGDDQAVKNVSLSIRRGEKFALLGSSGSGKTTLLRLLAGFEAPTAGRILIDGVDMSAIPAYSRPVSMMFQSYALFPHMSVERNVSFGLQQRGLTRAEIRQRVYGMLDMLQMSAFADRRPHQLSGGQRQRVALARSLVTEPKLLLLDEPLGALDKKLRGSTQFELLQLQQRLGITFLIVTHDQEEAMILSDRIAIMQSGQIAQIGTPLEVYETPGSPFVADFVGDINLLEGMVVDRQKDTTTVANPALANPIVVNGSNVEAGSDCCVALRPEKIEMMKGGSAQGVNSADGEIQDVGYMGNLSIYIVRLPSGKTMKVSLANNIREGGRFKVGDKVDLRWHQNSGVLLRP